MLEVGHVFEVFVRWALVRTEAGEDFSADFGDNVRLPGEFLEEEGESAGGCVTAG